MPQFFFQTLNGKATSDDDEGVDLPDAAAADTQARHTIAAILKDEIGEGKPDVAIEIVIRDDSGTSVSRFCAEAHVVHHAN